MFIVPGRQLVVDGPEVMLDASASQAIGLALHELATNALKHGAWSDRQGKVTVSWSRQAEAITLSWTEAGGPRSKSQQRQGSERSSSRGPLLMLFAERPC